MKVVVTGAGGFVGRSLVPALREAGHDAIAVSRRPGTGSATAPLFSDNAWAPLMRGTDAIVHLAAHNPGRMVPWHSTEKPFTAVNADGTAWLARTARSQGVRHFVFMSSARVYGTPGTGAIRENEATRPEDAYARSKLLAEQALEDAWPGPQRQLTVFRAPLILGPGRHGGAIALAAAFARGWPVPASLLAAPKSVLGMANLVAALLAALTDPQAFCGTFNIADDGTTSLRQIANRFAARHGNRATGAELSLLGRMAKAMPGDLGEAFRHLSAPCVLDTSLLTLSAGWRPPHSLEDSIERLLEPRLGL